MKEGVAGEESLIAARLTAAGKVTLSMVEADRHEVIDIAARVASKATTSQGRTVWHAPRRTTRNAEIGNWHSSHE